jgi:Fe-Mn family superoxide dismutase
MTISRRDAIRSTLLAGAACALVRPDLAPAAETPAAAPAPPAAEPFSLPPLPYAVDALEPSIDARTMEIHHGKHHAAYVANLNKAVAGAPELAGKSIEDLLRKLDAVPEAQRAAVRNNGGGHYNHTLFWQTMKKGGGGAPKGELALAIEARFGSFDKLKDELTRASLTVFGSGWSWLTVDGGQLRVEQTANQDTPLSAGRIPLLGIDVWEHAYYLKYQNRRADYVAAFFNVVDWDAVGARFVRLKG